MVCKKPLYERKIKLKKEKTEFIKIIYFDEQAEQDYLDITNGGRLDWTKEENKERAAQILTEIEARAKGGFNIIEMIKASISGNMNVKGTGEISHIFDSTIKNTLLTDYLEKVMDDSSVKKFSKCVLYAPVTSASMYKMLSSYLTIVPKDQIPIDMEKLNSAVLGERGYYSLLVDGDDKTVLRFNIKAFSNNYGLADIGKMKLTCYGVLVGECKLEDLSIENEFGPVKKDEVVTAESVVDAVDVETANNNLQIYDVVLAGVEK